MGTGLWAWLKKKNELPDFLPRIHYSFQGVEQIFWFLLLVDVGLLLRLSLASHMSTEDLEYKSLGQWRHVFPLWRHHSCKLHRSHNTRVVCGSFWKRKKKEDFSLLYKSTAVFNCLHFYLVYRNVDVISKIFWEVSSETWLEFLGSISFTKNGINIAKVLID